MYVIRGDIISQCSHFGRNESKVVFFLFGSVTQQVDDSTDVNSLKF